MRNAVLLLVLLTGCSSDDSSPIDAPAGTIDSPTSVDAAFDAAIDAPTSTTCTGQLYDRCTTNAQCLSGTCRLFNNLGVSLCTQACTVGGAACPTQGGTAVTCVQNSLVCRPAMANTCTPP